MADIAALKLKIEEMQITIDFLLSRDKSNFDDIGKFSKRCVDCGNSVERSLTSLEDQCADIREHIDIIMDKIFPDHCTYLGDIKRALEARRQLPPSKPKD